MAPTDSVTVRSNQARCLPRVDDEATIVLTYPHAQAIIQASWNWPFSRKDMEVYGREAMHHRRARHGARAASRKQEISADANPLEKRREEFVSYLRAVLLGGLKPEGHLRSKPTLL